MKLAVDGREAWAYTGGKPFDPALPCTVLVHGAMNDHSVWALQSRSLAHHGRSVLAVDLPGHGRSAGPALPSVEAAADWLLALLAAAGVRRATLAGHSMGSLIALEAAARWPESGAGGAGQPDQTGQSGQSEGTTPAQPGASAADPGQAGTADAGPRLEQLVMIGTAFPMKVSPALLETALADPLAAIDRVNAFSISTLAAKPSNPGPGTWLHGASRALMRRLQARYAAAGHGNLFHHDFSVCDRYTGGMEAAARVRCPVRLVLGGRDVMTQPRAAGGLAQALHAESLTLASGHSLMGESPDAVLAALQPARG